MIISQRWSAILLPSNTILTALPRIVAANYNKGRPMIEMVERVARAMEPSAFAVYDLGATSQNVYDNRRFLNAEKIVKRARKKATIAIQEMRCPTEAMITLGWQLIRGNLRPDEIYPHMIDEALKPKHSK